MNAERTPIDERTSVTYTPGATREGHGRYRAEISGADRGARVVLWSSPGTYFTRTEALDAAKAQAATVKTTPGPWFVRYRREGERVLDCFVAGPPTNGLPYDAEILGDDEYREDDGIDRKVADACLIAAALDMKGALLTALDDLEAALPVLRAAGWKTRNEEATIRRGRAAIAKSTGNAA
jgi:hypothetical protein